MEEMNVKFFHVREVEWYRISSESDGGTPTLSPMNGLTIAYQVDLEAKLIYVNFAKCRTDERFCYAIGRQVSAERLLTEGPLDILDLDKPIPIAIKDWVESYFNISIHHQKRLYRRIRHISTFEPFSVLRG